MPDHSPWLGNVGPKSRVSRIAATRANRAESSAPTEATSLPFARRPPQLASHQSLPPGGEVDAFQTRVSATASPRESHTPLSHTSPCPTGGRRVAADVDPDSAGGQDLDTVTIQRLGDGTFRCGRQKVVDGLEGHVEVADACRSRGT